MTQQEINNLINDLMYSSKEKSAMIYEANKSEKAELHTNWIVVTIVMCLVYVGCLLTREVKVVTIDNTAKYEAQVDSLQNFVDTTFCIERNILKTKPKKY